MKVKLLKIIIIIINDSNNNRDGQFSIITNFNVCHTRLNYWNVVLINLSFINLLVRFGKFFDFGRPHMSGDKEKRQVKSDSENPFPGRLFVIAGKKFA